MCHRSIHVVVSNVILDSDQGSEYERAQEGVVSSKICDPWNVH